MPVTLRKLWKTRTGLTEKGKLPQNPAENALPAKKGLIPVKVSEITEKDVLEYIRKDEGRVLEVEPLLSAALAFIRSYTGLTDEEIDEHEDFYIVVLILCQDMYDNRVLYVEKNNLNKVVDTILGMHRKNLL